MQNAGPFLASGSRDKTIKIWDVGIGLCLFTLVCTTVFIVNCEMKFSTGVKSDGNAVAVLFYETGTSLPLFFFLYTRIVNCNFPQMFFSYKADFKAELHGIRSCSQL